MNITPWVAIGLNALYAILTGLTVPIVDSLGFTGHDTQIVAWSAILAVPLNMVLHALSSSTPGPLAPADPPAVVAAQRVADLTPNDPVSKVIAIKQAAVAAVEARNPKAGPA